MEDNTLITLTGASGSGKSTLEKYFVKKKKFKRAISYTTREPRDNELDGKDYYFTNKENMDIMNQNNELAELTEYNNNYYAVSIKELMDSNIIVIEPNGLKQIRQCLKGKKNIISIYLDIDEDTMRKRMKHRGDSDESIEKRIEHDKKHFIFDESLYDYRINTVNSKFIDIVNIIMYIMGDI